MRLVGVVLNSEEAENLFGKGARFHHVGIGVRSIEKSVNGLKIFEDPIQHVRVAFTSIAGLPVELIESASNESPIDRSLSKGMKLMHLCYEVPSLNTAIEVSKPHGFRAFSKAEPAVAFEMRKILWLFHPLFGLFELVENPCNQK